MQKSTSLLLVFALLAILSVVFTQAKVSFEFTHLDQYNDQGTPLQIRIKTSKDENINGMQFTSTLTDADAGAFPKVSNMTFVASSTGGSTFNYPQIFGAGAQSSNVCINTATGQVFGVAAAAGGSITIIPNGAQTFSEIYDKTGNYGDWDITCAVFLGSISSLPLSITKNMVVTWWNEEDVGKTETIEVAPPTQNNGPELGFVMFGTKWKKTDAAYGTIDFSFETKLAGIYDLSLVNGPIVQQGQDGDKTDYYCSNNGNKQFGRIVYTDTNAAKIILPSPPTGEIKCQVQMFHNLAFKVSPGEDAGRTTNPGIRIKFGSRYTATSYTDFKSNQKLISRAYASTNAIFDSEYIISINGGLRDTTVNPITNSSVFKFDFTGSDFPVQKIDIERSSCSFIPGATISTSGLIITVKDFKIPNGPDDQPPESILCNFLIKEKFNFEMIKDTRFNFILDDKKIKSQFTNKDSIEILYQQRLQVENTDEKGSVITTTGDDIKIVDSFTLSSIKNYPVPIDNANIIIGVRGNIAPVSAEDYEKYITCTFGNDKAEMSLKYDASTLTWTYTFTHIDFKTQVEYNIPIQCTRQQKKLVQYGIDITAIPSIEIYGYILGKDKNAIATSNDSSTALYNGGAPETKPDGVKVPEVAYLIQTSSNVAIPTNKPYTIDTIQSATNNFQTRAKDILSSSTKDDYTVATVSSPLFSESSTTSPSSSVFGYFDITAYPQWITFIKDQLKVVHGYGLSVGNVLVATDSNVGDALYRYQLSLSQLFIASSPKTTDVYPSPNVSEDALESDWKLNAATDYVSVQDTLGSSSESYQGLQVSGGWDTKVDGCGVIDGLYLRSFGGAKPDWSDWNTIRMSSRQTQLCALGQSCKISTDCHQSFGNYGVVLCESSKCTFKPNQKPRVSVANTPQFFSLFIIATLVIVALLF